jgi:zinc/manganese transport system substrate-binding protein
LLVAASINAWGSILAELGGNKVEATSIIRNPATDPHDYEPTPADGRTIAESQLFVENGIGYDSWAAKAVAADTSAARVVIDVGRVTRVSAGGNPHRWYSPTDVAKVADAITAGLKRLDGKDAAYFDRRRAAFDQVTLRQYHRLIAAIKASYTGVPIGASESLVSPLAQSLGLHVLTPATFLQAVSEGTDPSPADKATVDTQIRRHEIAIYAYNAQNATPDVTAQVRAARSAGIPVVTLTETLSPTGVTFAQWQVTQLRALATALHEATGR